jgi:hypothetical protein
MKVKGMDPKIIAAIIIMMAVVLFSVAMATGVLKPISDLLSMQTITDILARFNVR